MCGINVGKGSLVVKSALHGAHDRVEHTGSNIEGIAGKPVVGDDVVAS